MNIPNSVTSIGKSAFSYCKGLTSVVIGSGVTSIGYAAFSGCSSLDSITSLNPIPPTIGSNTFEEYNATLYVPSGAKAAYSEADYWKKFVRIVERGESTGIEEVVPAEPRETVIYDLSGCRVMHPVKGGVYIVKGKKRIF